MPTTRLMLTFAIAGCATALAEGQTGALRVELRPAESHWDSEPRERFEVGDEVMLRIRLPVDSTSSASISVGEYRIRVQIPPRRNYTWPTLVDQTVTLDPPHLFRADEIPALRWPLEITEAMADEEGPLRVLVTIPELGFEGSTRLRVTKRLPIVREVMSQALR